MSKHEALPGEDTGRPEAHPGQSAEGATRPTEDTGRPAEDATRPDEEQASERRPGSSDRRVQIAAAKLRVVLDERLKRPTPGWVKRLAEQKLAS